MQTTLVPALFVAVIGLVFLGTIILNILAIVYILSARDKTTISVLVVNLAIADIIHAMGIIFFSSNLFTRRWMFGEFGCKFSLTTDVLCTVVIVYTVAALSIERYIDARSILPAKYRVLITLGLLILIWTLGLLLGSPFIIYTYLAESTNINVTGGHNNSTKSIMYSCQSHLSEDALLAHEIILYIIAFIIPYAIIVLFSLKLLNFLRVWIKRKEQLTRTLVAKKRTRGVKLVLCIVLSFLMCFTPFWIFKFYTRFLADEHVVPGSLLQRILFYIHLLVVLISHLEGMLNPLFFIVLTERFCLTISQQRQRRKRRSGKKPSVILFNEGKKSTNLSLSMVATAGNSEINGFLLTHNNNDSKHNNKILESAPSL